MRSVLWSSIDNAESKDLDQIEFAEELPDKGLRLLIGIADVDALIKAFGFDSTSDNLGNNCAGPAYSPVLALLVRPEGKP